MCINMLDMCMNMCGMCMNHSMCGMCMNMCGMCMDTFICVWICFICVWICFICVWISYVYLRAELLLQQNLLIDALFEHITGDCKIIGNRATVFNDFSSSKLVQKLVQKSVENSWASPNYFAIPSICLGMHKYSHLHSDSFFLPQKKQLLWMFVRGGRDAETKLDRLHFDSGVWTWGFFHRHTRTRTRTLCIHTHTHAYKNVLATLCIQTHTHA